MHFIHLVSLHFKNKMKEIQAEIEGDDRLWTSNASPVTRAFVAK